MGGKDFLPYILTVSVMIVLVTIAGIVLYVVRGRLFGKDKSGGIDAGGVLETMRAMRDRGEISEEEYRTTQAAIVAKAAARKAARDEAAQADQMGSLSVPTKRQTRDGESDERRAKPGYDLTGEPLPPSSWSGSGDDYREGG